MKRIFLISTLLTILFTASYAQKNDAQDLLKRASEKAAAYQTISADFTYNLTNTSAKLNDSQKGKLTVKGNKYRLEIARQIIICDGKTLWTIMPDAKEVQINSMEDMEDAITPNKIFTDYYKDFTAKSITDKTMKGVACQIIELDPINKKDFSKAALTISKSDLSPQELQMTDKKGTIHTYILDGFKANQPVEDTFFSFKSSDYGDYEVIDLR